MGACLYRRGVCFRLPFGHGGLRRGGAFDRDCDCQRSRIQDFRRPIRRKPEPWHRAGRNLCAQCRGDGSHGHDAIGPPAVAGGSIRLALLGRTGKPPGWDIDHIVAFHSPRDAGVLYRGWGLSGFVRKHHNRDYGGLHDPWDARACPI